MKRLWWWLKGERQRTVCCQICGDTHTTVMLGHWTWLFRRATAHPFINKMNQEWLAKHLEKHGQVA